MNTIDELKAAVMGIKGASYVSLVSVTKPKTINPAHQDRIVRVARRSGMINVVYERSVNRQRGREGLPQTFLAGALWNGNGIPIGPSLVRHRKKPQEYLVLYPKNDKVTGFAVVDTDEYYIDGKKANTNKVKALLVPQTRSKKQGTQKLVPWRLFKLQNIKKLTIGGNTLEFV
jgi:hypothetical protein